MNFKDKQYYIDKVKEFVGMVFVLLVFCAIIFAGFAMSSIPR